MCILCEHHKITYRRIFANVARSDVLWSDILDLLRSPCVAKLNTENPGDVYVQEKPDEVILAYCPSYSGGEQPVVVVRRKYARRYPLPDELEKIRYFLLRAGFPKVIV